MLICKLPDLKNIIDDFDNILKIDEIILSESEILDIYESCLNIIDEFVNNNMINFRLEHFDDILKYYVIENLKPLIEICFNINENIEDKIINIYDYAHEYYFNYIIIPRSYSKTFIKKKYNISKMKKKIEFLKNSPQPMQQTEEWYKYRSKLLTASSLWKIWGSDSVKNQLIYDKCLPFNFEKYNSFNTESTLHHGHKYEPLSIMYYEYVYKTKIYDFGCITHEKYNFIGASPDGINICEDCNRFGRMLEIKNIVNREITGIPKEEYWIQMQLQMETCNLDECDFLETHFIEYEDEEQFLNDETENLKGIIVYFIKENKPYYVYMPMNIKTYKDMFEWANNIIYLNQDITWMKNIYWKLEKISCILVCRNEKWFNEAIKDIQKIWNIIVKERKEGYEHRAPKKVNRKAKIIENEPILSNKCLINNSLFNKNIITETMV